MPDKYSNFDELRTGESVESFRIVVKPKKSITAIIAPHGGKIEHGTSQIAQAIAGAEINLYCFEGRKVRNNLDLHITSTNFDEPQAIELVSRCANVVAIHGCAGDGNKIYLGGLDEKLRDMISTNLQAAGFTTGIHTNPNLQGTSPQNICNRGRRSCGVQLEISSDLRTKLSNSKGVARLEELGASIRSSIGQLT